MHAALTFDDAHLSPEFQELPLQSAWRGEEGFGFWGKTLQSISWHVIFFSNHSCSPSFSLSSSYIAPQIKLQVAAGAQVDGFPGMDFHPFPPAFPLHFPAPTASAVNQPDFWLRSCASKSNYRSSLITDAAAVAVFLAGCAGWSYDTDLHRYIWKDNPAKV